MTAYKKKRKTKTTTLKVSDDTHFEILTKDNLFGYIVNTTDHGAEAHCLHCPWTWSTEGGTIRGAFNAAEKRARAHTTETHPEKSRNLYTAPLCTCGHTQAAHTLAPDTIPRTACNQRQCTCLQFVPALVSSTRKEEPTP